MRLILWTTERGVISDKLKNKSSQFVRFDRDRILNEGEFFADF